MKRTEPLSLRRGLLAGGVIAFGLILGGMAAAPRTFETESGWLDDRLPAPERELMQETVGFAFPGFGEYAEDLKWLANEPEAGSLDGKILILQSFTSADAERRSVLRRAENLARRTADDAVFIAVHTPENAEEAERFSARSRIPVVLDTTGRFSDDMGFWKTPAATVIDQSGTIRIVGANVLQAAKFVPEIAQEKSEAEAPKLLSRDEREKKKGGKPAEAPKDAKFPDAPAVRGANDLTNKPGPAIEVQKYLTKQPDTTGKVVMVEFWATWCGPCIAGIPHLNELQNEFRDDLVIIGVSDEDEGKVNEFRSDRNRPQFDYTIAIDPQRRMINTVGTRGIPHCIVMSSDGIVRWQGHPAALRSETMKQIIDANKSLAGGAGGDGSMRWVKPKAE